LDIDLDLETLDLLQEHVADYPGTVIVVSHDRDFLDRTVTRIVGYEGSGRWQAYAGGYSDMVAQRGHGVQAREAIEPKTSGAKTSGAKTNAPNPTATNAVTKPANKPKSKSKTKLSYKHKHRLDVLPGLISTCEAQISALETRLADPDLFSKHPDDFKAAAAQLEALQTELEGLETEWLELEMLKD